MIQVLDVRKFLATPSAPGVTPTGGTNGAQSYKAVAVLAQGGPDGVGETVSAVSAATATAVGPATLDLTHFNTVVPAAVAGATHYDVYRTAGGPTQGKIGRLTSAQRAAGLVDNGLVADGTTAPATTNSGVGAPRGVSGDDRTLEISGTFTATMKVEGRIADKAWLTLANCASLTAPAFVQLSENVSQVRAVMTAYTSGAPDLRVKADFI